MLADGMRIGAGAPPSTSRLSFNALLTGTVLLSKEVTSLC